MIGDELDIGSFDRANRVDVEVEEVLIDKLSSLAMLIKTNDGEEVWIPHSLMEDKDYNQQGYLVLCSVPEWFAIQQGLV